MSGEWVIDLSIGVPPLRQGKPSFAYVHQPNVDATPTATGALLVVEISVVPESRLPSSWASVRKEPFKATTPFLTPSSGRPAVIPVAQLQERVPK